MSQEKDFILLDLIRNVKQTIFKDVTILGMYFYCLKEVFTTHYTGIKFQILLKLKILN